MIRNAAAFLALTVTVAGCASGGGAGTAGGMRRSSNTVTQAELADPSVVHMSIYDAIQRLRPAWLRTRAVNTPDNRSTLPVVMINEVLSSMDGLRDLPSTQVTSMEYMSGPDATTLYGTGYVNGLIKVKTGAFE